LPEALRILGFLGPPRCVTPLTISDESLSPRRFFCLSHKIICSEDVRDRLCYVHSCPVRPSSTVTPRRICMAVATAQHVLSDDILTRCAERAPVYDRENRFFTE